MRKNMWYKGARVFNRKGGAGEVISCIFLTKAITEQAGIIQHYELGSFSDLAAASDNLRRVYYYSKILEEGKASVGPLYDLLLLDYKLIMAATGRLVPQDDIEEWTEEISYDIMEYSKSYLDKKVLSLCSMLPLSIVDYICTHLTREDVMKCSTYHELVDRTIRKMYNMR